MGGKKLKIKQNKGPPPFLSGRGGGERLCAHLRMFALVSTMMIKPSIGEGAAKVVCDRDGGPLEADQGEQAGAQEVYETGRQVGR